MDERAIAESIFGAAIQAGRAIQRESAINDKKKQIRSVESRRCGNCDHWMKSSCKPEKIYKQFKSCDSMGCEDFTASFSSGLLAREFKEELATLTSNER